MVMLQSPVAGKYEQMVDSDSAHEMLARRAEAAAQEAQQALGADHGPDADSPREFNAARRYDGGRARAPRAVRTPARTPARRGDSPVDAFAKSFARQLGSRSGQALMRGVLGGLLKGR